jgi:hypothetical protein
MSHMRYWSVTMAAGAAGGFLAIDKFAFSPSHAVWIAFGVAIGAAVFSLAATGLALTRQNHQFSGISALSALVAGFTIIATRVFTTPTALWLVFAGGVALLLLAVRALAVHETTVERVVYALGANGSGDATLAVGARTSQSLAATAAWTQWLSYTGVALAGAFIALATFAWQTPGQGVSVRWLAFGVGIAAAVMALAALIDHAVALRRDGSDPARVAAALVAGAVTTIAAGLIVLMVVLHGSDARWWAFALADGLVGGSLIAAAIHELSSERVRHELEVAGAAPASRQQAVMAQ